MKFTLFTLIICLFSTGAQAQHQKDSLLNAERSIDRPITLHGGQFRINGGYDLAITTKRYDPDGDVVRLKDEGISYATHSFLIDLRYGLHEYVQIGMRTHYRNQTQRNQQIISFSNDVYEVFEINKKTGLEDLLVTLHIRAPFKTRKFDLVAGGGYFIPLSNGKASQPEHVIIEDQLGNNRFYNLIYTYRNHWGTGGNSIFAEGAFKYRSQRNAFSAVVNYQHSPGEGENVTWYHQLVNNEFQYRSESYKFQSQDVLAWLIEYEYQFAPWFDFSMLLAGRQSARGWDEINDVKVSKPASAVLNFSPGYEILVTPKIWLRQRIYFSVSGKSAEAPFIVSTSLVYNFFPF
jgi:hypothetical protein